MVHVLIRGLAAALASEIEAFREAEDLELLDHELMLLTEARDRFGIDADTERTLVRIRRAVENRSPELDAGLADLRGA